ncbi:MAG: DUF4180 domain-containing protein [Clostridia bacterium]
MKIEIIKANDLEVAKVTSDEMLISDVQSALDFMSTVKYETGYDHIIVYKALLSEDFFNLKTRLAGEVLQKFVNYQVKIAIIGDFSSYTSKSLQDFIYESNRGNNNFFVRDEKQALEKLSDC